jgi:hypothetical protein
MQNIFTLFVCGLLLTFIASCVSEPEYPDEPVITYRSISKSTVQEGDSLLLTFSFTDGDGNLGKKLANNADCSNNNCEFTSDSTCYKDPFYSCYIIDMRDSCFSAIALPDLDPNGNVKAISGEIDIVIPPLFCKCMSCPNDQVEYQIIIRDASGNYSNVILSETISISCF